MTLGGLGWSFQGQAWKGGKAVALLLGKYVEEPRAGH